MQEQDVLIHGELFAEAHDMLCCAGNEKTNITLHMHNDEARSQIHHGRALGHFSCSHPGLRIAMLVEDMELTGLSCMHRCHSYCCNCDTYACNSDRVAFAAATGTL